MYAVYAGMLVGAIVATTIFGGLLGWLIRKITSISVSASYLAGLAITSLMGGWVYSTNVPAIKFPVAVLIYGVGSIFSYFVLVAISKKRAK